MARSEAIRLLLDAYSDVNSEDSRSTESELREKKLLRYCASLFRNEFLTDLTIVVGDERIKVHKIILIAQSSVFKAMFESDYKESAKSELVIEDCDFDVLMQMLEYMYTGTAPKINEMAGELLTISQKYDLNYLKTKCEKALVLTLCVNNVLEMLVWADRNHADRLEEATIDFIKKHYKEVRETRDWKELHDQHPNVLEKIVDAFANYSPSKKKTKSNKM